MTIEKVSVHPSTLGVRDLVNEDATIAGVYGGTDGKVWVASFADPNEAHAFILASNQFRQPVNGYLNVIEATIQVANEAKN